MILVDHCKAGSLASIFASKLKVAIFAWNQIESKSWFLCTTETILSTAAFCSFTLPCCDEIQSHSTGRCHHLHFIRRRALGDRCSAVVRPREGRGCSCFSLHLHVPGEHGVIGHLYRCRPNYLTVAQSIGAVAMNRPIVDACCHEVNDLCIGL